MQVIRRPFSSATATPNPVKNWFKIAENLEFGDHRAVRVLWLDHNAPVKQVEYAIGGPGADHPVRGSGALERWVQTLAFVPPGWALYLLVTTAQPGPPGVEEFIEYAVL